MIGGLYFAQAFIEMDTTPDNSNYVAPPNLGNLMLLSKRKKVKAN